MKERSVSLKNSKNFSRHKKSPRDFSVFLEKEGFTPRNKVFDFLIIAQDFDYSLKEIAKFSNISYTCMKMLKKELVKDKWILLTRKIGKAQMYKLNIKNEKVKKFIDFFWSVVEEEVESKLGIKKIDHSGPVSMPVSARSM